MALVKSRAVVLRTYRLGETSKVVVCYTRDYGKVRLVAKGARKGGGRLGAALEPMLVSGVVFYLTAGRDLSLVSQAEVERQWRELRRDVVRMAYAGAVLELVDAVVPEREADPDLFELVEAALDRAATAEHASLDAALWRFEVSLANALGYGPELSRCVGCGREPTAGSVFVSGRGGVLCGRCEGPEPGAIPLSDGAREALSSLSDGAAPALPAKLGALSAAVRDEVGDVLRSFLAEHSGGELKLRSLDFLAQVRRTEEHTGGSGQT